MTDQTAPIYYISPTNKIHSNQCRHFKADTDGWQKMDSYSDAISTGAKPCKICSPKTSEVKASESENKPDALEPEIKINESGNKPNLSEKEVNQTTKGKQKTTANPPIKAKKKSDKADTTSPKQQDLFAQPISTSEQSLSLSPPEDKKTEEQSESSVTKQEGKKHEQPLSSTPAEEDATKEQLESSPIKDEDSTIEKLESSPIKDEDKIKEQLESSAINDDDKIKEQSKSSSSTKENTTEGDSIKEDATKEEQSESVTSTNDNTLKQSEPSISSDDKEVKTENDKGKGKKTQSKNKHKKNKKTPVKYKTLAGNGCHQAISEVQGVLVPPIDNDSSHQLILPDGLVLEATFKDDILRTSALERFNVLGSHWFRGYPKMQDDKLVAFQIIAWDYDMPTSETGLEKWEFIGLWTLEKTLIVQRSITARTVRKEARKTGLITEFKFTFTNIQDWIKEKKLWIGYVYKLLCSREGDTLKIEKVIPYACPRFKPVPKTKPVKKKPEEKATKPKQDPQTDSQPQGEKE